MLITTTPNGALQEICSKWKHGDNLQDLIGGQLFGSIASIELDDPLDVHLSTSTSILLEDCALMTWIEQQSDEEITVGCQWAGDYQCGAIALSHGSFKQFTISTDALMDLQKALLLEQTDASVIDALRNDGKSEGEIEEILWEWSHDYRVEARDGLQTEFLRSVHERNQDLTQYPYFKMLTDLGCDWEINDLPKMASSAVRLLTPIDYENPEQIDSIFGQQNDEFWKVHRDRIHGILKKLPAQYRNRVDLFRQIIPKVAAWVLEYAGPAVRSDKDILRLAIEADKTQGYGASALEFADPVVFEDREFLKEVLTQQIDEYYNLPATLKKDRELLEIILKQGFPLPAEHSSDRELIESYVTSGDRSVYDHLPEKWASDPELAKLYLRSGGDWFGLPQTLKTNAAVLHDYLALCDFDNEDYPTAYYLKQALESHLQIDDWDSATLQLPFIQACLDVTPRFFCMLNYPHLKPSEWRKLIKEHNPIEYGSRAVQLYIALTLKKEYNDSMLFDQLNNLSTVDVENSEVNRLIEDAAIATMELELSILEMEKTPENLATVQSMLKNAFGDQSDRT